MKGKGLFPIVDFIIAFILEEQELNGVKKKHAKIGNRLCIE